MPSVAEMVEKSPSLADILAQQGGEVGSPEAPGAEEADLVAQEDIDLGIETDDAGAGGDIDLAAEENDLLGAPEKKPEAKVEVKPEETVDTKPVLTDADISRLRESADFANAVQNRYSADPVEFINGLIAGLKPTQQKVLMAELGVATAVEPEIDVEGLTPQEAFIERNRKGFEGVLQLPQQIPAYVQQQLATAFEQRDANQEMAMVDVEALKTVVEELLAEKGLKMPTVDTAALTKAIQGGKDWKAAVREQVSVKQALETSKKREAQRVKAAGAPKTPGNGSGVTEIKKGASLADIMASNGWL